MAEQAEPVSHFIVVSSRGWALWEAEAICRRTSGWPWGEPVAYMHCPFRAKTFLAGPYSRKGPPRPVAFLLWPGSSLYPQQGECG